MAVPKIMGTETEYGIIYREPTEMDPVAASMLLVNHYVPLQTAASIWDYAEENPLVDARGFEVKGEKERPSPDDNRATNKILPNGGRYYVDYAHPEYSTPECSNARDVVRYEKAGDRILNLSRDRANRAAGVGATLQVYKNNSDGKGNSYGCHENFLLSRQTPFDRISEAFVPFLCTRQIYAGAGKVGAENRADPVEYQISQRADFFETLLGLDTMSNRPIMNTRDEPHAAMDKYRRLHVIVGDSNMSEYTIYLKVGTAAIVLTLIEDGALDGRWALRDPVRTMREVSHDIDLKRKYRLERGIECTAVEIQREYLNAAHRYYSGHDADPVLADVLAQWEHVLTCLEEDPMQLARQIDWVIKRELIEGYVAKRTIPWTDPRVAMIDLQYHDVRPDKGLYYTLERQGYVDRIVTDAEIQAALEQPPEDTRAYFRGMCLQKFPQQIYGVGWSAISFKVDATTLKKVPMQEPARGTKALVGALLAQAETPAALLEALST